MQKQYDTTCKPPSTNTANYNKAPMLSTATIKAILDEQINKIAAQYAEKANNSRLVQAMSYSLLAPGKRIRGILSVSCANIFNAEINQALILAAVIEIIHTYSLVHDDLPAMDNADIRRNQKSCHKNFCEATAILVGDALLTLAFELLADDRFTASPTVKCALISKIAETAGYNGMIGGQMLDIMHSKNNSMHIDQLTTIQMCAMKTGQLFVLSCISGAMIGHATEKDLAALQTYASNLGLAFQIIDDLQDNQLDPNQLAQQSYIAYLFLQDAQSALTLLQNYPINNLQEIIQNMCNLLPTNNARPEPTNTDY